MPNTTRQKAPDGPAALPITDVDELTRRLTDAEERDLDYWIHAVVVSAAGSMTVRKLQDSLSWRVTRPLRAVRIVQIKIGEAGLRRTLKMVRTRLDQIRQSRKRG